MIRAAVVLFSVVGVVGCRTPAEPADGGAREAANAEALARLIARFGWREQVDDLDIDLRRVRAALRSGRLEFDPAVLETCLQASAATPFIAQVPLPPECVGLWRGQTPTGGACDTSLACRDGFCGMRTSRCGTCLPTVAIGAPCQAGFDVCANGSLCLGDTCALPQPPGQVGQPCPCAEGLRCGPLSLCVQPRPTGSRCTDDSSCTMPDACLPTGVCGLAAPDAGCQFDRHCQPGHACGGQAPNMVCVPSNESGPCGLLGDRCGPGLVCGTRGFLSRCVPARQPNQSCVFSSQCPRGYSCADGACRRVMGPGASCTAPDTACMEWTTCVNGRCSRRPREGEQCVDACAYSTCRAGTCVSRGVGAGCFDTRDHEDAAASCGVGLFCDRDNNSKCALASVAGKSCAVQLSSSVPPCDEGTVCTAGTCETPCVLGDGAARDDFQGPAARPLVDAGCIFSGPEALVVPLTDTQAACAFGSAPECLGCHRASGCWELRPRGIAPPPNFIPLNPSCGIDAGR